MSVTVALETEDGGAPEPAPPEDGSLLGPIVVRLSTEYGVHPEVVRGLGTGVLASFAGARVQAFVPILVEKRLRETLRGWRAHAGPSTHAPGPGAGGGVGSPAGGDVPGTRAALACLPTSGLRDGALP